MAMRFIPRYSFAAMKISQVSTAPVQVNLLFMSCKYGRPKFAVIRRNEILRTAGLLEEEMNMTD